ncbi:MAG TPA: BLUF domain-containing protein [Tepidisphaeraceae bacterium]|jgi:hypothetical protein
MDLLSHEDHGQSTLARIIYVSRRSAGVSDDDVVELALRSSRRNRVYGVTGCLWFGDKQFFQILEGDRAVVDSLFTRIQLDARNCAVRLLSNQAIITREFTRWALTHIVDQEQQTIDKLLEHYLGRRNLASQPPLLPRFDAFKAIDRSVFPAAHHF